MKIQGINTSFSSSGMTVTYDLQFDYTDAYGVDSYRGVTSLTTMQAFTAMSGATATDPMAGFRLIVLNDFRTHRIADIAEVDALIKQLGGTVDSSETTSSSTSTSTSQSQA